MLEPLTGHQNGGRLPQPWCLSQKKGNVLLSGLDEVSAIPFDFLVISDRR